MANRTFLGTLRLALLLSVLAFVALGAWLDRARSRDWDAPLRVTVYPIAAASDAEITSPPRSGFRSNSCFPEGAGGDVCATAGTCSYGYRMRCATVRQHWADRPGLLATMPSLRMRFWAVRVANDPLPIPTQIFALYHDSAGAAAVPDRWASAKA
jgi:hypothetical protein